MPDTIGYTPLLILTKVRLMKRLALIITTLMLVSMLGACGNKPLQLELPENSSTPTQRTTTKGQ